MKMKCNFTGAMKLGERHAECGKPMLTRNEFLDKTKYGKIEYPYYKTAYEDKAAELEWEEED